MAVSGEAGVFEADYRAVFETYIEKSVRRLLGRARLAETILPLEDRIQTFHTLHYAFKLPAAWPVTRELLLTAALHMEQAGHRDEWMSYLEQAITLSRQMDDSGTTAELELQLGVLYQLRSNYQAARRHLEASIRHFETLKESLNQARALNRLAYVARMQRRFDEVAALIEAAQCLLKEDEPERAYSFYVLALVALDKRHWPDALNFSQESFRLWERKNDKRMMGRSLISRGFALHRLADYQAAIAIYEQAITLFNAVQDTFYQSIVRMNLGNVYVDLNQPAEALKFYLPAEQVFRQVQDELHLAMVYHNMGRAYHQLQQWDKAETVYLLSLQKKQKLGNIASLVNTMGELGATYLAENQPKQARAMLQEALQQLRQIEGEPGYEFLREMITTHLQQVSDNE